MNSREMWAASALVLTLLVVTCQSCESVVACAPAFPRNKPVEIADESAIIIWDATSKTQHFIRRASFSTEAADFGFLVPTPTKPTLAEASDEAFGTLAKITEPRVVTKPQPPSRGCGCGDSAPPAGSASPVRVLEEKRVAGHDAVVLEADSADALSKWLKDHAYDFSPSLAEWVKPYVAGGWKITAFKIAKDTPNERSVPTAAVRMTFQTDRPFFPYREPPEGVTATPKEHGRRLLRVFFLSENRVQGTLGQQGAKWPGHPVWANQLNTNQRERLLQLLKLPEGTPPASWWLTEFEDHSSPRPGTLDVYFSPSVEQTPKEREPHIRYVSGSAPDCIMCYALAAYVFIPCFIRYWRRKGGKGTSREIVNGL